MRRHRPFHFIFILPCGLMDHVPFTWASLYHFFSNTQGAYPEIVAGERGRDEATAPAI